MGRQHEKLQSPFHIDTVGLFSRHFGLGRKRGRQVKDDVEIIIVKYFDLVDQIPLDMFRR